MNKIEFGDCREIMKKWAKEGVKVQTCVTSPPYFNLRNYDHEDQIGMEETPEEYIAAMVEVFRCVRDLLSDTGTIWINIGDSYFSTTKGSGGSNPETSKLQSGKGKENFQAFKPVKISAGNTGCKPKDLMGIPWMLAFALRADGWVLRQDIIWHKPSCMPESVTDRCTKAHEYIFLLAKQPDYYFDNDAIKTPVKQDWGTRDRADGKYHNEGTGLQPHSGLEKSYDMANKRSVWSVSPKPYKGAHFAVYPEELIEPCILAGSKKGDIVLDPFMGSGTTAAVAVKLGRQYLGCELNTEYGKLQQQRIKAKQLSPTVKVAAHSAYPTTIKKLF